MRRLKVAQLNFPSAEAGPGDLRKTWPIVVDIFREKYGYQSPVLLTGCPPCQGMSSARGDRGKEADPDAGSRDGRNLLVLPIARAAKDLRPTFVVVENVPAFLRRQLWDPDGMKPRSAANILLKRLRSEYHAYAATVDLCEYGIPQHRVRTFLTLVRKGSDANSVLKSTGRAPFPAPTHGGRMGPDLVTIDDALRDSGLPALDARTTGSASYQDHPMHRVPVWPARQYKMVAAIPPRSGRSAWETSYCTHCDTGEIPETEAVCPQCQAPMLRPTVQEANGSWRLIRGFRNSSYRRMHPARPAATITTASGQIGSDRTLHPWENRVLSPAECSLLQTIPDTFQWGDSMEKYGHTPVRQMIGEAVPPRFTALHGQVLAALALGKELRDTLSQQDSRCLKAHAKLG